MIFLDTNNPYQDLTEDPFCFPRVFLRALDGPMTLSETIEMDKGKVLIYRKEAFASQPRKRDEYAFVVCWDRRLDWNAFSHIYALYEERATHYVGGEREQIEPVFIAKSIDNDVLRFIQLEVCADDWDSVGPPHRTFLY